MSVLNIQRVFEQIEILPEIFKIPYSSLLNISQYEANDASKLARVIVEKYFLILNSIRTQERPKNFTLTKNNPIGTGLDEVNQIYTFSFTYTYNAANVTLLKEPTLTDI